MIIKTPLGSDDYVIDLSGRLRSGEAVTGATATVAPDSLTVGSITVASPSVIVPLSGGNPLIYSLLLAVTTSTGRPFEYSVPVAVRQESYLAMCEPVLELMRRLRERLRSTLRDQEITLGPGDDYPWETDDSDALWSNDELLWALNDARDMLFRARPMRDDTTEMLTSIPVIANQAEYLYDPRIAQIHDMRGDNMGIVGKTSRPEMDAWRWDWESTVVSTDSYRRFSYYEHPNKLGFRLYPIPEDADTLHLTVSRMPLERFTWTNRQELVIEPEPQWYEALIDGAEWIAYSKHDSQTYDPSYGEAARMRFMQRIGRLENARDYEARRRATNLDGPIRARVL